MFAPGIDRHLVRFVPSVRAQRCSQSMFVLGSELHVLQAKATICNGLVDHVDIGKAQILAHGHM